MFDMYPQVSPFQFQWVTLQKAEFKVGVKTYARHLHSLGGGGKTFYFVGVPSVYFGFDAIAS